MAISAEQMEALLTRVMGAVAAPRSDASGLGPMRACEWGMDRMKRVKYFKEWKNEAEVRMKYMSETDSQKKLCLIQSWGGPDLIEYMTRIAGVTFEAHRTAAGEDVAADTYDQAMTKVTTELAKHVNRTMAVYDLFNTKQDSLSWMEFVHLIEDKALICQFDEKPYTFKDAVKDALVMGVRDNKFRQKALMDDPDLDLLTKSGISNEEAKETADVMTSGGTFAGMVRKVAEEADASTHDLDGLIETLTVMKMKKAGKYSNRFKKNGEENRQTRSSDVDTQCKACLRRHDDSRRCPALGRTCFDCQGENHFSKSSLCPKSTTRDKINRLKHNDPYEEGDEEESYSGTVMEMPVNRIQPSWPGIMKGARRGTLRKVKSSKEENGDDKWVDVIIGKERHKLFTDTGSYYTIIPPEDFKPSMGKVIAADTRLRAWGTKGNLDVKGMIKTKISTLKGASTRSKVYIVSGYNPEPLLGEKDAEELGFIKFNKVGREPTDAEKTDSLTIKQIPQKIRENLKVRVETSRPAPMKVPPKEKQRIQGIVDQYKSSVFNGHVGKMKQEPIHLDYVEGFHPKQPPYRPIPIHYQKKVSDHLEFLRQEGVIEDVDPKESYECVMNVVITDKPKSPGDIRMNIDNTPWNEGMKRTQYHVQTPQEIRHELSNAKVFSEMDMGFGYHQMELDEESSVKAIFQTHEGCHKMNRLYFGPTAGTGIFHSGVRKALQGVPGTSSIHDNIIVHGVDFEDHARNLIACLERCAEKGITLKLSKCNFGQTEIEWFGRVFSAHGVSADPNKIKAIIEAGRPTSLEEVRSLLQACQYNAKFLFDSGEINESYEDVTKPLRELLHKDAKFIWDPQREKAYVKLMKIMSSPATLRPFDINKPTMHVADASEHGMSGSVYQIEDNGVWVPIDHASRSLSEPESKYDPIDRESLAQAWSMDQFRYFLLGTHFTSYTDHEPLLAPYNNPQRKATGRINKHRYKVQDLNFNMKYMRGDENPCDYGSRHTLPINYFDEHTREVMGYNQADEICIRKVIFGDLPDAVTVETVKEAALKDNVYQKLYKAVKSGNCRGDRDLIPYTSVWRELSTYGDTLVLREDRIVIPDCNILQQNANTNIRKWIVDLAHEAHDVESSMKRQLRARVWFPGMDKMINKRWNECHTCQTTGHQTRRDPLIPSTSPQTPWECVDVDHWGPTPDGKYLLVIIDRLSRFPEIKIVSSTSAEANIEAFDETFSRHNFPEEMKSDGGPPFNGSESHLLRKYLKYCGIKLRVVESADDPEANGLAESFMRKVRKTWQCALLERKNPRAALNSMLRTYRGTIHPTTGKSPASLVYNRPFRLRIPDIRSKLSDTRTDIKEALEREVHQKAKQKFYKDNNRNVRPHSIQVGDRVLLAQKTTKRNPPFNPKALVVTEVRGHQIKASNDSITRGRDAQKFKVIHTVPPTNYDNVRSAVSMSTQQEDEVPDMIRQHRTDNTDAPHGRQETPDPVGLRHNAEGPANIEPPTPPPRPYNTRSRAISNREAAQILSNVDSAIARAEKAMGKFQK